ncbi:uncharacterized protein BDZ99DRAFT_161878 [Mytilinidion resinicola]|uniref:Uncharacterized protein n=1 Tax=Mytilinidion resinicola TaxID=574789 RepID=A0A6A6Y550_9PEZI|nr:uncharacterized protein BDZ99DRAFT_161878 [Mytilinidion resinicola]KAF2803749.1 hypothetical protein BDZ99DRAFT_161878 [Mytilinidion resinicola]
MPKPPPTINISKADAAKVGPCPQDQDAYVLDETSKQSLQRHLHKFVKAAQTSFAKGVLQQDHIRFLSRINDEAKVRRSTKSEILAKGVGKVMSYEDLEAARAARAAKEQAKAEGKGKRGRKRKSPVEADAPETRKGKRDRKRRSPEEAGAAEPKAKVAQMSEVSEPARAPMARMSEAQVEEDETAPKPWRAPVARMW